MVSEEFYMKKFLPFYLSQCNDIYWGVRKSCIDIIVELSKISSRKVREN